MKITAHPSCHLILNHSFQVPRCPNHLMVCAVPSHTFKIIKKFAIINDKNLFEQDPQITRNSGLKLKGQHFSTHLRKNYLNVRVLSRWNRLPANDMKDNTVNRFKTRLYEYFNECGFLNCITCNLISLLLVYLCVYLLPQLAMVRMLCFR